MGQSVSPVIAVEGGRKATDEDALSDPSFMPSREDLDVLGAEVVAGVGRMLHYGGLVGAGGRLSCGHVLRVAGGG